MKQYKMINTKEIILIQKCVKAYDKFYKQWWKVSEKLNNQNILNDTDYVKQDKFENRCLKLYNRIVLPEFKTNDIWDADRTISEWRTMFKIIV